MTHSGRVGQNLCVRIGRGNAPPQPTPLNEALPVHVPHIVSVGKLGIDQAIQHFPLGFSKSQFINTVGMSYQTSVVFLTTSFIPYGIGMKLSIL